MENLTPAKRTRSDGDQIEGRTDTRSTHQAYIDAALSTEVILKEIFKNLSNLDLLKCCKVNKTWATFLDPLICSVRLTIRASGMDTSLGISVTMETQERGTKGIWKMHNTDLENLPSNLRIFKKYKYLFIELQLRYGNAELCLDEFLQEFGDKIHIFECLSQPYCTDFSKYLRHLFFLSRVEVIKWNRLSFHNLFGLSATVGEISLPNVRKIYLGEEVDQLLYYEHILSACRNVVEIWDVPTRAADLIERYGKIQSVKSIRYCFIHSSRVNWQQGETTKETHLERFRSLGVKLTAAAVPNIYQQNSPWDPSNNHAQDLKKFTHEIFKSSRESVKYMTIPAAKCGDFYFPMEFQMPSVKILLFEDNSDSFPWMYKKIPWKGKETEHVDQEPEYHYFPRGTNMLSVFPNVGGLEIKFHMLKRHLLKFFPSEIFGAQSLGPSIKKLKIRGASPDSFPHLLNLFPHVTHLEMESTFGHFNQVFPIISNGWKRLERLTLFLGSGFNKDSNVSNFDSILTGIPENICQEIKRGKNLSSEEVVSAQRIENSILNLRDLRKLQLIVHCANYSPGFCPTLLTGITVDYALMQLPSLEVEVRMDRISENYHRLVNTLEPVADYVEIENGSSIIPEYLPFL